MNFMHVNLHFLVFLTCKD